jgi:hypothetical protein
MAVYTVHQPPVKKYESSPDPERFEFVRDGFSFWAFVLGPLWMLRHRMWLVLIGYIVLVVALELVMRAMGASGSMKFLAYLLMAILIGMEAGTLRRFTLGRRRWKNIGLIVGDDRESAERRFYDSWVRGETLAPSPASSPAPPPAATPAMPMRAPAAAPEVIGLFPQPGAPR